MDRRTDFAKRFLFELYMLLELIHMDLGLPQVHIERELLEHYRHDELLAKCESACRVIVDHLSR